MKFNVFLMVAALVSMSSMTSFVPCQASAQKKPIVLPRGQLDETESQDLGKLLSEAQPSKGYEILEHQSAQQSNKLGHLTVENSDNDTAPNDQL